MTTGRGLGRDTYRTKYGCRKNEACTLSSGIMVLVACCLTLHGPSDMLFDTPKPRCAEQLEWTGATRAQARQIRGHKRGRFHSNPYMPSV